MRYGRDFLACTSTIFNFLATIRSQFKKKSNCKEDTVLRLKKT